LTRNLETSRYTFAVKRILVGILLLAILSSCDTFHLTTGKTNDLVDHTELLTAINTFRATNTTCTKGSVVTNYTPLAAYQWNTNLETAALSHANYLEQHNTIISLGDPHNGAGDSSVGARLQAAGFSSGTYGENIGAGQVTVADLIVAFKASTNGHCNNLMDSDFTQVGAARVTDSDAVGVKKYDNYWVLDFGKN
jgi:uncharacterized protein YkwD